MDFGIDKATIDGYATACKACKKEASRLYRTAHRDKVNIASKKWRDEHKAERKAYRQRTKDHRQEYNKQWAINNPEAVIQKSERYRKNHPDTVAAYGKRYRANNPEFVRTIKKAWVAKNRDRVLMCRRYRLRDRFIADPEFEIRYRLRLAISTGINMSLKSGSKKCKWQELLGYSVDELKAHLEARFLPGMTWANRSEWHIDHIRPIASFQFTTIHDPDFYECWKLDNLQPLWIRDNLSKGAKYVEAIAC